MNQAPRGIHSTMTQDTHSLELFLYYDFFYILSRRAAVRLLDYRLVSPYGQ